MKLCIGLLLFSYSLALHAIIATPLEIGSEPAQKLSQAGLFQGKILDLKPIAGLKPYQVNQPLWSDYAQKKRWIFIPANTKVIFDAKKPYSFPIGTILVKHFSMEVALGKMQFIETRVLVHKEGNTWKGYTYKWDQDDAYLVAANQSPTVKLDIDASAIGGARIQSFKIPSRRQCLECHNKTVGFVRSFRTHQLNLDLNGINQIKTFEKMGFFKTPIPNTNQLPSYAKNDVKSYLAVNCVHCHNPKPSAPCGYTGLDFRYEYINISKLIKSGHIIPGSKETSEIYKRMNSSQMFYRMPFIGSNVIDIKAVDNLGKWIDHLPMINK